MNVALEQPFICPECGVEFMAKAPKTWHLTARALARLVVVRV